MAADLLNRFTEQLPRSWKASLRDTFLLLGEFRGPVLFFTSAMLELGCIYYFAAQQAGEPVGSLAEAIYLMLTLTFLQPSGNFPSHPFLQTFFFMMPLIGVGTLASGLADFGLLFFNRRARNNEWEMAVASTFNKHTILVGLGHLGFRVVDKLHELLNVGDMIGVLSGPEQLGFLLRENE